MDDSKRELSPELKEHVSKIMAFLTREFGRQVMPRDRYFRRYLIDHLIDLEADILDRVKTERIFEVSRQAERSYMRTFRALLAGMHLGRKEGP